jgi:hypothetical protein
MTEPTLDTLNLYIERGEGYILLDHAIRTPEELDSEVIRFAQDCGYVMDPDDAEGWERYEDLLGREHLADEAIDWLNAHHCPSGAWWGHDGDAGAFGCWPITEDDA